MNSLGSQRSRPLRSRFEGWRRGVAALPIAIRIESKSSLSQARTRRKL
jgi:hypothetical protein